MTKVFFDDFPALWDAFEQQLEGPIVKALEVKIAEGTGSGKTKLSSVYWNIGFDFWCKGMGFHWKEQLDEVFFESRYYKAKEHLTQYSNLDVLVAQRMENLNTLDAQERYRLAVMPLLDKAKKELMAGFAEMGKELEKPFPYAWKLPVDGHETALLLGFQKRYKKRTWGGMDGYTYSFNGRNYTDIRAFMTKPLEKLSDNVSIARDTLGHMFLRRYTEIPTFDSSDREWDSEEIEYLMFDGKNINLIIMRGGYKIAYLTFYENLLTADARMKPLFEKLGWPRADIEWT